ncbi:methyltransferase [Gemmatimonadetes bacterium T265]|nr:methyltransferase [Gemmatimonadetes bacterium T265]
MAQGAIRFDDGAGYERFMGAWSRLAGAPFLDWLAAPPGLAWLDVGCGNGAFTELLLQRCAPAAVHGVDPSAAQLAYARTRFAVRGTPPVPEFRAGDARALPYAAAAFDAAVMPLVIFFVPEPAVGVAELARVVRPGGLVAAYAWDLPGGGFPYAAVEAALRAAGRDVPGPPRPEASSADALRALWTGAGLEGVETREMPVCRTFAGFDDYWATVLEGPAFGPALAGLAAEERAGVQARLRERLPAPDAGGRLTVSGRANAVRGRVPRPGNAAAAA